jgi:UDP-arabinose 4-epimerase
MKVLVTGGAGYVGSHACKELARRGHLPITYDNLSRGHRAAVRWGPLEEGEINDHDCLNDAVRRHQPEAVMHFAAYADVAESFAQPNLYHRNNVLGSQSLLDVTRAFAIRHFVFSSSCAVYGVPAQVPIAEDAPLRPINPYGENKLATERLLRDHGAIHGVRSVSLRYFNAAGADPAGEAGESHDPETHAVPRAIFAALGQIDRFEIFGDDYPTPDGTAIRDYVHVTDLAEAHIAALHYLHNGGQTAAFNLGTGRGTSVLEVLRCVEDESGRHVPVARKPRRPGDPPVLVADASRANTALGWQPSRSDIRTIVRTALAWHGKD